ncbi:MAG TPA: SLC13 family permease [Clostridia bacterium]|nr:SLC13 family permease [Clostridia bacterium]
MSKKKNGNFWIKLLSGPIVFFIIYMLPFPGLEIKAKLALATYLWLVVWWLAKPIPWSASAFFPLLLLPLLGVINLKEAAAMYGQRIFFLLIFVFLFSKVVKKYEIGDRLAVNILAISWIKGSFNRFLLIYILANAFLSAMVSMPATLTLVPIGIATVDYIIEEYKKKGKEVNKQKMYTVVMLSALLGAQAGYPMTYQAVPHNVIVTGILEKTTGITATYVQWLIGGVIIGVLMLIASIIFLRIFYKPEVDEIPGGNEYFRKQKENMPPLTKAQKKLFVIIGATIVCWFGYSYFGFPWMDFYWVSFAATALFFLVPANTETHEGFLTIEDVKNVNWEIILLVTTALGFAGLLSKVGIIAYVADQLAGVSGNVILAIAAFITPLMTNFLAGMATATTMATLLMPLAENVGINPMIISRIIPAMSVGFVVPWAGSFAAIIYSFDKLKFKDMVFTGVVMSLVFGLIVLFASMILVPGLELFTVV